MKQYYFLLSLLLLGCSDSPSDEQKRQAENAMRQDIAYTTRSRIDSFSVIDQRMVSQATLALHMVDGLSAKLFQSRRDIAEYTTLLAEDNEHHAQYSRERLQHRLDAEQINYNKLSALYDTFTTRLHHAGAKHKDIISYHIYYRLAHSTATPPQATQQFFFTRQGTLVATLID